TIRNFLATAERTPDEEDLEQDKKEKRCTTWVDVATVRRLSEGGGFQYSNRTAPAVRNIVQQWRTNSDAEQVADLARRAGAPDPKEALQEMRHRSSCAMAACLREAREEAEDKPFRSEPLRAFLHGVPGAGKSQTLKWLRGFFEEICRWTQGQEFVCLASQNTQAALIDGNTLHSFAELQVKAPKQSRQTQFGPDKFVKYQRLRWLIVDECSAVALQVLAVLQKRRPARDFWQFPAVRATSLFQNPFSKGVSVQVANLRRLFWTHGE
ncbi:unnamed protein product, partial [Effrenium voratum]